MFLYPTFMQSGFEIVLFDLGGVLIDSCVIKRITELSRLQLEVDEIFRRWPSIGSVRDFDLGLSTPLEFAAGMIKEFSLTLDPQSFVLRYDDWVKLYPQTLSLLDRLSQRFTLAVLPNTNEPHWARAWEEMGLKRYFSYSFPSCKTGLLKPAEETYLSVLRTIDCPPGQILFFDDYQPNVDGAISVGMAAFRVRGALQVEEKLKELGMI